MSLNLQEVRCFNHVDREAVAKCPMCDRFFCRECVTEHEGRVICRSCLETLLEPEETKSSPWLRSVLELAMAIVGFCLAAYVFILVGRFLLRIPSQFHSGISFE